MLGNKEASGGTRFTMPVLSHCPFWIQYLVKRSNQLFVLENFLFPLTGLRRGSGRNLVRLVLVTRWVLHLTVAPDLWGAHGWLRLAYDQSLTQLTKCSIIFCGQGRPTEAVSSYPRAILIRQTCGCRLRWDYRRTFEFFSSVLFHRNTDLFF